MNSLQAKQYAEAELASFINADMSDYSNQVSFLGVFERILRHFHRENFYVVNDVYEDMALVHNGNNFHNGQLFLHWVVGNPRWVITPDGRVFFNGQQMK